MMTKKQFIVIVVLWATIIALLLANRAHADNFSYGGGTGPTPTIPITVQNGTAGTTLNSVAVLDSSGKAIAPTTSASAGAIGIVTAGAGNNGSATVYQAGVINCNFDGATTSGDWVVMSNTVAGDCSDAGSVQPTYAQPIGFVLGTTVSAGLDSMVVQLGTKPGFGGTVNVQTYGARCSTGSFDSTTAIQAAINAATPGGAILVPACPVGQAYVISSALTSVSSANGQTVRIEGEGWQTTTNAAYGNSAWTTLSNHSGSVIYQKTASTDVLDLGGATSQAAPYFVRDLMLLGPGSGTENGLALGHAGSVGAVMSHIENVMIANNSTNLLINNCEECGFYDVHTRGGTIGLSASSGSGINQNVFSNFESNTNATCISWVGGGNANVFTGGLCQNATTNGYVFSGVNQDDIFEGIHFENTSLTGYGIECNTCRDSRIAHNTFSDGSSQLEDIYLTGAASSRNLIVGNNAGTVLADTARLNTWVNNNFSTSFNDFELTNDTVLDAQGSNGGANWLYTGGAALSRPNVVGNNLAIVGGVATQIIIPTPTGLAVTHTGTSGSTSWCYRVTAKDSAGETLPEAEVCDATGNASLSTTPETVTWANVVGASTYNVYGNTTGAELLMTTCPNGTGCSATAVRSFTDNGTITPSGALPTVNNTGGFVISTGNPKGLQLTSGSVFSTTGGTAPTATCSGGSTGVSLAAGSTDNRGIITTSSSASTNCTITFNHTWPQAPFCDFTDANASATPLGYSADTVNTTTAKFDFASATSAKVTYHCF